MAAVGQYGSLPHRLFMAEVNTTMMGEGGEGGGGEEPESLPVDGIIFVGMSLLIGIASRQLLRGTRVPYTVALLAIGIGLGVLGMFFSFSLLVSELFFPLLFRSDLILLDSIFCCCSWDF